MAPSRCQFNGIRLNYRWMCSYDECTRSLSTDPAVRFSTLIDGAFQDSASSWKTPSASPRHDHGGWPAARAHAQRPWSRCRHLLRSPSSSPHTPAAPFQHRASDLAVRASARSSADAWYQEVQKGLGATFSAFPGVIDHMNGPQSQRESVIGETGVIVLRLDMPIACNPLSGRVGPHREEK